MAGLASFESDVRFHVIPSRRLNTNKDIFFDKISVFPVLWSYISRISIIMSFFLARRRVFSGSKGVKVVQMVFRHAGIHVHCSCHAFNTGRTNNESLRMSSSLTRSRGCSSHCSSLHATSDHCGPFTTVLSASVLSISRTAGTRRTGQGAELPLLCSSVVGNT